MALASLVSFQEQKLHYFARRHSLKLVFEHSNKKQKRFFREGMSEFLKFARRHSLCKLLLLFRLTKKARLVFVKSRD